MLDWLGDVTSTVSFCQLSGGVCYPMNLCINYMLCMEIHRLRNLHLHKLHALHGGISDIR